VKPELEAPVYAYLGEDEAIDHEHPDIQTLASGLRGEGGDDTSYARLAFEYVRDEIAHSLDVRDPRVTWRASDVLAQGVGLCFAKSHLYVALLRAAGIPAGLCYQRLSDGNGGHVLHGLAALELDGDWTRQDPRGDRPGLTTQFSLEGEWLAYTVRPELGETDYPTVYVSPHPAVLSVLREWTDVLALCDGHLPGELP
jgi:transglutaminase-like putative cysteine protease